MASKGSFGGGLNPFGSSSSGGLSGYSIGSQLASLDAYKASVGWQNGTVSDDAYIASLQKVLDAATPDSTAQVSAQNTLDNAKYGIGRQAAQDKGLDDLIAFDQKALAGMRSDNQHADDVKNALGSELAQRRNKDYSDLVNKVNTGEASTQSLLDWVNKTIASLPTDAPDKDNWAKTKDSVAASVQTEKDSKVYQDYNAQRMSGADFLTYIQGRRDQYSTDSPNYAEWGRKLEDATKNVTDTAQSAKDTAFFDQYNEGHASDADYLSYIKTRLDTMDKTDPQYETWHHRYETTAYSLAEDQLRFAVNEGTRPVSSLVSFYQSYESTLNPGSAEWRTTQGKIDSLKGSSSGGSTTDKGTTSAINGPKVIDGNYSLDTVLHDMALPPNATKADEAMFTLNYNSLNDAHTKGDQVWLFVDPQNPGAVTQGKNPDGTPIYDANGKPVMVRGSAYMPVSDEALGNLNILDSQHHSTLAQMALQVGDLKGFYSETNLSNTATDKNRGLGLQGYQKDSALQYKNTQAVISQQLQAGDLAGAYNTTMGTIVSLSGMLKDPNLDQATRDKITTQLEDLSAQPWMPQIDDATRQQTGGAITLAGSSLNPDGSMVQAQTLPDWHFMLADGSTQKTNGWVQDTGTAPSLEEWQATHRTVTTQLMGQTITGDVAIHSTVASPQVALNVNGVDGGINAPKIPVQEMQYKDESGNIVTYYSIDGTTWVSTGNYAAGLPMFQLPGGYTSDPKTGVLTDAKGNKVGQADAAGNYNLDPSAQLGWYGSNPNAPGAANPHYNVHTMLDGQIDLRDWQTVKVANEAQDVNLKTLAMPKTPSAGLLSGITILPGTAIQTIRKITQPGQSNQDLVPSTFKGTPPPTPLAPGPIQDLRQITQPGQSNQDLVPSTFRLTPPTPPPPPAPVVQALRPITQPGQSNQDVTLSKPKAPVTPPKVIQPTRTSRAV